LAITGGIAGIGGAFLAVITESLVRGRHTAAIGLTGVVGAIHAVITTHEIVHTASITHIYRAWVAVITGGGIRRIDTSAPLHAAIGGAGDRVVADNVFREAPLQRITAQGNTVCCPLAENILGRESTTQDRIATVQSAQDAVIAKKRRPLAPGDGITGILRTCILIVTVKNGPVGNTACIVVAHFTGAHISIIADGIIGHRGAVGDGITDVYRAVEPIIAGGVIG
jgi:hypothetical protein